MIAKRIFPILSLFLLLFSFVPDSTVFAEETSPPLFYPVTDLYSDLYSAGKTMDELVGEIAYNLLAINTADYTEQERDELQKSLGGSVLAHLDKRAVGFNGIIGNVLDGDVDATWSSLVHFLLLPNEDSGGGSSGGGGGSSGGTGSGVKIPGKVMPVESGVDVTITDDLLSAIAEALVEMQGDIEVPDDFRLLKTGTIRVSPYGNDAISPEIPLSVDSNVYSGVEYYLYAEKPDGSVAFDLVNRSYVNPDFYSSRDGGPFPSYSSSNAPARSFSTSVDGHEIYFPAIPFTEYNSNHDHFLIDSVHFYGYFIERDVTYNYSLYYKPVSIVPNVINQGDVFNNTYSSKKYGDMTSREIYNDLHKSYPKDFTVNHKINNNYTNEHIYDDYDLPPTVGGGSDGDSGFLSALGAFIASIPGLLLDLVTSIVDALVGLVEVVIRLFIPTAEQFSALGDKISALGDSFRDKFSGIFDLTGVFTGIFSQPADLFDKTFNFSGIFGSGDLNINPLPSSLREPMVIIRRLAGAALVFFTFINIYKRIVGSGDVIK